MNAIENFNSIATEVIASAQSEKALAFAEKVVAQVRAQGEEWITANAAKLEIKTHASVARGIADVADNRVFFLGKWQAALLGL